MIFVVRAVLRTTALVLSYFLSTVSAAGFLTFVLFLGSEAGWLEDPLVVGGAAVFAFSLWIFIAQIAFAPTLIWFLVAEIARLSGLTLNLVAGGLCAVFVLTRLSDDQTVYAQMDVQSFAIAIISAGIVAGFTHWMLAGHRAGTMWAPTPPRSEKS